MTAPHDQVTNPDPVHPDAARWGGWSWRDPERGEHFRRCSYCGSIHPADLAGEPTWRAEWADQKYGWPHKFYVDIPDRGPGRLFVVGAVHGPPGAQPSIGGNLLTWVAPANLTEEQRRIVERDGYRISEGLRWVGFGTRAVHNAKHYSIHLADPDLDPAVRDTVQQRSGIRFDFVAGQVRWHAS